MKHDTDTALTAEQIGVLRVYAHGNPFIMDDTHYGNIAGSLVTSSHLEYAPPPSHGYVITDKGRETVKATMPRPNTLWVAGGALVKMGHVYSANEVTATVVYEGGKVPGRTTVRRYTAADVDLWREPSDALIARYEIAWGYR